ncbi:antifreeze protein [Mycena alexandri]|uniref:Antifreeze protein n=1 Tax=Mycena alexandri TaxID=1745969 RepID=A0AAD6XEG5_9AGAR|nr:antifreeze protein [Mycena alexandri]
MISTFLTISFLATIGSVMAQVGPGAVNLRTAGNYAILAQTGITCVPTCREILESAPAPAASTFITGCSLILDSSGKFSTSSQVTGEVFAADYATPTPATLTVAIGDMQTAYTDAMGRTPPNFLNLGSGAIGGLTLTPGLYRWNSGVTINSDVTIAGGASDTWIFQVIGTLTMANAVHMTLTGGALPKNIVWVVTGAVTTGTTSLFQGVILGKTGITLKTGATANSRLLAQTAVSLQQATVNN